MGRKDEIIIQAEEALGTGDVLELPDGQSVKIDRNVAVGGRLKLQYAGKPFKQPCRIMRTRNESLIRSVTEQYVKNSDLKEKLYGYVSISKDLPARIDLYHEDDHAQRKERLFRRQRKDPLKKKRSASV